MFVNLTICLNKNEKDIMNFNLKMKIYVINLKENICFPCNQWNYLTFLKKYEIVFNMVKKNWFYTKINKYDFIRIWNFYIIIIVVLFL